jgi:hypothetical protein
MSCKFCEALKDSRKQQLMLEFRDSAVCDNFHEFINETRCDIHFEGVPEFAFVGIPFNIDGSLHVSVMFSYKVGVLDGKIIQMCVYSKSAQWNFCPCCGEQLSQKTKTFDQLDGVRIHEGSI